MRDDTLYFKYRIDNKSDNVFVLYKVDFAGVKDDDEYLNSKNFYDYAYPRLWATIINSNNEYAIGGMRVVMRCYFPPDSSPSRPSLPPIKYLVLQPYQSVEYDNSLILHSMKLYDDSLFISKMKENVFYTFVSDGIQNFQLEYFSGPAFRKKFRRDKQRDSRLKNSIMFEGIIKSNVCTFSYPHDYKEHESGQLNEEELKNMEQDKSISYFQHFKLVKYLCLVFFIVLLIILIYRIIRKL